MCPALREPFAFWKVGAHILRVSSSLGSLGPVDPELLQLRVKAMRVPQERMITEQIIAAAFATLKRIHGLDFATFERDRASGPTRALWQAAENPIADVWRAVEELQHAAKPLVDEHEKRVSAEDDISFDVNIEGDGPTVQPQKAPAQSAPKTPIDRIGETVWATSFVLGSEIDGFRKRLPTLLKVPDAWELLSDVQDHVGHIKAALQAILTGIYGSLYPNEDGQSLIEATSHDEQNIDLLASRDLRQRIFALRDDLLGLEASLSSVPTSDWQSLLKRAVDALHKFMFGPGFAWMRASDKRTFIKQHRAISEILEIWSPLRATPARRAVQNLARYLEALEIINQRECLVLHDRASLAVVVDKLEHANSAPDASKRREYIAAGLAALADAQGRDKQLDQLLETTLAPGSPVPTTEILQRAKQMLSRLQR